MVDRNLECCMETGCNHFLMDFNGKVVFQENITAANEGTLTILLSTFAKGTYLLVVEGKSFRKSIKLVVL